jgi:tetratricopeptide (TPR) repeat protein
MLHLLKTKLKNALRKPEKSGPKTQSLAPLIFDTTTETLAFTNLWQAAEKEARLGNLEDARSILYQAMELQPNNPTLLYQLGLLEEKMQHYEEAADNWLTVIHLDPSHMAAYVALGEMSLKESKIDDALNYFEQAHQLDPNNPAPLCGIGNTYIKKLDFANAIATYEKAIDIAPDYGSPYNNLGNCYSKIQQYDRALSPLLIANALDPLNIEAYINLNFAYYSLGKFGKAYRAVREALKIAPNEETLHWILSWSLLLFKRFDKAWIEYESRFSGGGEIERRDFPFPLWQGESLNGKKIFIAAEQGLGDQIMFASCLPDIINQAEHCILECHEKLTGLLQHSFSTIEVIGTQQIKEIKVLEFLPSKIDYYIRIGSLPLWLRKDAQSFVPAQTYIKAEKTRIEYWKKELAKLGDGLKVGISWRGGVEQTRNYLRTIPLCEWREILALDNIDFISLQYGNCEQDLLEARDLFNANIQHWPEAIENYQETAALVSALDLVVSVCTSVIHLSGALGQHTWVLVPFSPEWRYLAKDETLPWYQNAKLFRQQQLWQWRPVIDRIALELTKLQTAQNLNK